MCGGHFRATESRPAPRRWAMSGAGNGGFPARRHFRGVAQFGSSSTRQPPVGTCVRLPSYRGVAKLGIAPEWGSGGRQFKSARPESYGLRRGGCLARNKSACDRAMIGAKRGSPVATGNGVQEVVPPPAGGSAAGGPVFDASDDSSFEPAFGRPGRWWDRRDQSGGWRDRQQGMSSPRSSSNRRRAGKSHRPDHFLTCHNA